MISKRRAGRLPALYQAEAAECGIACLAMVASYHGHHLDLNEARHRFKVSRMGTSLKTLVNFAHSIGFSTRALRAEPENLPNIRCPAILHLDLNHFVVLKEMRGSDAFVHDPGMGPRRLSAAQLHRRFTGIVLELSPAAEFERQRPARRLRVSDLARRLPIGRGAWPQALGLSVAFQLLVLAAPLYVQLVVDRAIAQGDSDALSPIAIGFTLLVALRVGVAWVRSRVLLALGGYLDAGLVANVVRHMLRLPSSWFAARHVSTLLTRMTSTQPIRDLVAEGLIVAIVDGAMATLTIVIAIWFSPYLAIVVLAGFALTALLKWRQVRRSLPREHDSIEAHAKAQQEFIETVRGIAAIKLFRKEADREARWSDAHILSVNARYHLNSVRVAFDIGRDAVQGLVLILVVLVGGRQVIEGTITLGVLMAFVSYQQSFAASAASLLDFAGRLKLLDVHLQRLADVLQSEPEPQESVAPSNEHSALSGRIEVEDVSFRYGGGEEPVLTNVTFSVAPGEFVAITGPSGGGKTTLMKLLVGLLDPNSGRILYDGVPLRKLGVGTLRDQLGVVMQDDTLLTGSLAQNITFFDLQPDPDWMRDCARLAAIHDDILLFPMGYQTLIGDMGTILSGGQRQRVMLARALYRRPRILFMDEGTSSLDMDREREVNENLRRMDITRLIIAHRRDTIAAADRILELTGHGIRRGSMRKGRRASP